MADVYNIVSSVLVKLFHGWLCKLCMIGRHKKPPRPQTVYNIDGIEPTSLSACWITSVATKSHPYASH